MIRFIVAPVLWLKGWLKSPSGRKLTKRSKEWFRKRVALERGESISAGPLERSTSEVVAIYLRPSSGEPPVAVDSVTAIAGRGLEGDHHTKGGLRQVTILSKESWDEVCMGLDTVLSPSVRRANLVIDKLSLRESVGQHLRVGEVLIKIQGETLPCRLMDEAQPGLKAALADWNGGVYGEIITTGRIEVGDACFWVCSPAFCTCYDFRCLNCDAHYKYDAENYHWPTTGNRCVDCNERLPDLECPQN